MKKNITEATTVPLHGLCRKDPSLQELMSRPGESLREASWSTHLLTTKAKSEAKDHLGQSQGALSKTGSAGEVLRFYASQWNIKE